jgi:hypothetical protein
MTILGGFRGGAWRNPRLGWPRSHLRSPGVALRPSHMVDGSGLRQRR